MKVARRSRLAVRTCPGCAEETLVSNGAFWICEACRYAVTSTALAMDRTTEYAPRRHPAQILSHEAEARLRISTLGLNAEPAWSGR